jgi:hypothetical protein
MDKPWWSTFWKAFLSAATARFILSLAALWLTGWIMHTLAYVAIPADNRDPFMVGLGYVMGLSNAAFLFYFGQSQKNEPAATGKPNDPVHVERDL